MKISPHRPLTRKLSTAQSKSPKQDTSQASVPQESVVLSTPGPSRKPRSLSKLKLGTLFWGAMGAIGATLPLVGPALVGLGSAALPRSIATAQNKPHSFLKSVGAGIGGTILATGLSAAGIAAGAATGSPAFMLPAAALGAAVFGYQAQIDPALGRFDLFG